MERIQKSAAPENQEDQQEMAAGQNETSAAVTEQAESTIGSIDDILDEIDGVLEADAEAFVRGYIQKGGQ